LARRLGVKRRSPEDDVALAKATFEAFAGGGEALRWEPLFFDWFCGGAERAMAGPRAGLYAEAGFAEFRRLLAGYEPDRPERLADPYFAQAEPEELLYDEIEALWAPIAERDDWSAFEAKLAAIEAARRAYGFSAD
jgi:hypothetical protein